MILLAAALAATAAPKHAQAPKSVRLYIFDCGTIHTTSVDTYSLKKEEVGSTEMAIPCILVAHPKGTLNLVGVRTERKPRRAIAGTLI